MSSQLDFVKNFTSSVMNLETKLILQIKMKIWYLNVDQKVNKPSGGHRKLKTLQLSGASNELALFVIAFYLKKKFFKNLFILAVFLRQESPDCPKQVRRLQSHRLKFSPVWLSCYFNEKSDEMFHGKFKILEKKIVILMVCCCLEILLPNSFSGFIKF